MNILDSIRQYDSDIDEKSMNSLIATFKDNYREYLSYIDIISSERKIALSLSLISRKDEVAKYILHDIKTMSLIDELSTSDDVKVRKNIYSTYFNIGIHIDRLYEVLDRENSYINIVHLLEILSHYDDIDMDKIKGKVREIDKKDPYYVKAIAVLDKFKTKDEDRLHLSKVNQNDYIYLTCPKMQNAPLLDSLHENKMGTVKVHSDGVVVSSKYDLDKILTIRSYYELLIAYDKVYQLKNDPKVIGEHISKILNVDYFNEMFDTKRDKYAYRLEIKGVSGKERVTMSKDILSNVHSDGFVNIRDRYDFEIRIRYDKDFSYVLLKVPYEDKRFDYRKCELPASISGVTANIISNLVKPYVGKFDVVIDGFVGTGTMLYEFYKTFGHGRYIGVDIESKAIKMAKTNIGDMDGLLLVKSDILNYNIKKKADIMISNLPFGTRVLRHDALIKLYDDLAIKLDDLLSDRGKAFLLTTNAKALKDSLRKSKFKVIKEFRVDSGGLIPYLLIIERT